MVRLFEHNSTRLFTKCVTKQREEVATFLILQKYYCKNYTIN
jgi:hypothetical protein